MEEFIPQTEIGKRVLRKEITDINQILDQGHTILEAGITDILLPGMEDDLLMVGQSKGKFGGGRRRVFRQTQKKTREGNKPSFAAYAVVGNKDGIVGLGYGKARETVPARDKAIRKAKINVFKIARGSGSWESTVKEPHTIPFAVQGRCGSVRVQLFPAPKGKGLVAEKEIQKILRLAGVQDVWSRTFGQTKNKINLVQATEEALRKLVTTKLREKDVENLGVVYGPVDSKQDTATVKSPSSKTWEAHEEKSETKSESKPKKSEDNKSTEKQADAKPKASTDSTPLGEVSGVGPARVKKLEEAGITSAEGLSNASVEEVAKSAGIAEGNAQNVIDAAKNLIGDSQ
jgi:small subunit ribosomal protein S5